MIHSHVNMNGYTNSSLAQVIIMNGYPDDVGQRNPEAQAAYLLGEAVKLTADYAGFSVEIVPATLANYKAYLTDKHTPPYKVLFSIAKGGKDHIQTKELEGEPRKFEFSTIFRSPSDLRLKQFFFLTPGAYGTLSAVLTDKFVEALIGCKSNTPDLTQWLCPLDAFWDEVILQRTRMRQAFDALLQGPPKDVFGMDGDPSPWPEPRSDES